MGCSSIAPSCCRLKALVSFCLGAPGNFALCLHHLCSASCTEGEPTLESSHYGCSHHLWQPSNCFLGSKRHCNTAGLGTRGYIGRGSFSPCGFGTSLCIG